MSPETRERRSFPRPPLWLNLALLILAGATFLFARLQRDKLDEKMAVLFKSSPASSAAELNHIREELSKADLTRAQLAQELDARLQYAQSRNSEQFYISVDTTKRKLYFRFGNDIVREADAVVGERQTIQSAEGKTWTFIPVKGAFTVSDKETDYVWRPPEWLAVMRGDTTRRAVANGLGKYVIVLQDNYVIHSPPPDDSPLHGTPKPGSIMVPEADLAAIWPRIEKGTRVYIF